MFGASKNSNIWGQAFTANRTNKKEKYQIDMQFSNYNPGVFSFPTKDN